MTEARERRQPHACKPPSPKKDAVEGLARKWGESLPRSQFQLGLGANLGRTGNS